MSLSTIIFIVLTIICWQPIYLGAMFGYHTFRGDTIDRNTYTNALSDWFEKLWNLIFSKPGA